MINYDIYYLSCIHYLQEIHHFGDVQFAVENHPHLFFASAWFKNGATVPLARGRHGGDLGLHIYQQKSDIGGFLNWWYPTTISFPTENDPHLGCEMGGFPPLKETPI